MDNDRGTKPYPTQIAWITIIACAVFILVSVTIGSPVSIRLLNSVIISGSGACCVLFAPLAWRGLTRLRPSPNEVMGLGLELASLGSLLTRMSSMMVRDFGIHDFIENGLVPISLFIILTSRLFQIMAVYSTNDGLPRRRWINIALILGCGVVLALVITALSFAISIFDA